MKKFVVHDQAGRIVRTGFCSYSTVALQTCGDDTLTVLITSKHYAMPEAVKVLDGMVWERVDGEWFEREPAVVASHITEIAQNDPMAVQFDEPPLG